MTKIMKLEREIVMKAARECYSGEDLEKYLSKRTSRDMNNFAKKVQERFLAILEKDHPGKNFIIGKPSKLKANVAQKIARVLKGQFLYIYWVLKSA